MKPGQKSMQIHGICLVRDEADIVEECLRSASDWCDHIYVLDNGSTDATWEIVQSLARELPNVIPWRSEAAPFTDGLRESVFSEFRHRSKNGDWWCRLDADEFYVDDPRVFLRRVPNGRDVVWTTNFSYYFTDKDADRYRANPELYGDDVPVAEKIRYYVNHWSEPRFFRYHERISWSPELGFPLFVYQSPGYPVRMWQRHYPYRSPQQIERRLAARQESIAAGEFQHEAIADWGSAVANIEDRARLERTGAEYMTARWEDRVVPASSLHFDAHDRRFVVNESLMPAMPAARPARSPARKLSSRVRAKLRPR